MRKKLLKNPFALANGEAVHISRAVKGPDYLCPACASKMIVRSAGQRTQAHFAHYSGPNCSRESVLHKTAKLLLEANLKEPPKPTVSWNCPTCHKPHTASFFDTTTHLAVEESLEACRPDITAIGQNGETTAMIEIVVTHKPEPRVYETAQNLPNVPVIEFHLEKPEDLEQLVRKELRASKVSVCLTPKCPECGTPLEPKKIMVWEFHCWQCNSSVPFAWAEWEHGSQHSPAHFSAEEIQAANQAGATIEFRFSKEAQGSYDANICRFCHVLQGDWYLHDHLIGLEDQVSETQKLIDHLKALGLGSNLPILPRTVHSSLACLQCGYAIPGQNDQNPDLAPSTSDQA